MNKLLFRTQAWLRHQFLAVGAHGLHSPRLFACYNAVFRHRHATQAEQRELAPVLALVKKLRATRSELEISDLGAGPGAKQPAASVYRRAIAEIARSSASDTRKGLWLYRLVRHFQPAWVLELGTNLGVSSAYMLAALPSGTQLDTVEGAPQLAAFATEQLAQLPSRASWQVHCSDFDAFLANCNPPIEGPALVFLDGNHRLAPTLRYVDWCIAHLPAGSLLVLDDIYWSPEMARAWALLCQNPAFPARADAFRLGLLWLGVEQVPETFYLRT
jgi:predicted O-methyltransferase YrrM